MKKLFIAITISSLFLSACGSEPSRTTTPQNTNTQTKQDNMPQAAVNAASVPTPSMVAAAASLVANYEAISLPDAPVAATSAPNVITTHAVPSNRPFVITADLTFRTPDVRKTAVEIEKLAAKYGGFVVANETSSEIVSKNEFEQSDGMLLMIDNYFSRADLTVRVPRQNAQAFLHEVQPYITLLENQHFSAEDVASQLQRQLLAAQREQQRSKDFQQLNQATKAESTDRRAALEAQYAAREQEDEAKVQQSELQDKIQFATINLHFRQPEQIIKHTQLNPKAVAQAHRPSFWASVKVALMNSVQTILSILLFIVKIWYIWLAIALFILWQRKRANRVREDHDFVVQEEGAERPVSRRRKKFQKLQK